MSDPNRKKLKKKAVELMNEDCNQSIPMEEDDPDFVRLLREFELEVTTKDGSSSQTTRIYGGGKHALVTVTQRFETENESDEELINEALEKISSLPLTQCKNLFKYDGSWERNVETESDYEFVKYLELVRGNDGYVLYARF